MLDTKVCKFCAMPEGAAAPGTRTGIIHINRDGLCAGCYTLLNKVRYEPEKVDEATMKQFEANCRWNFEHGMFVPVAQRRALKASAPVYCKRCGVDVAKHAQATGKSDGQYKCYCADCATYVRSVASRSTKGNRKVRSDAGRKRRAT